MADHVDIGELDLLHALDTVEHVEGVAQAGAGRARQVGLARIAGDRHARILAESG